MTKAAQSTTPWDEAFAKFAAEPLVQRLGVDRASFCAGFEQGMAHGERQRDALLGALKAVDGALDSLNWCAWEEDRNSVWVEWVYPAWDMARAAIAMVEKP